MSNDVNGGMLTSARKPRELGGTRVPQERYAMSSGIERDAIG